MHEHQGRPLWVIGHKIIVIQTTGDHGFADVQVTPGVPGPPPHYHEKADELYYVVEGSVEIMRDGEWHTVHTGESLHVPKGTLHSFRGVGDEPSRFITMHDPGAAMDGLFLDHGIPVDEPGSFERSVSKDVIGGFMASAADCDMIVVSHEPA